MTDKLKGKIAIMTGTDSGIGQATAEAFAQEGASVVITYLHDQHCADETRSNVEAAGGRAVIVQCDQRDPGQVARLFRETEQKFGNPQILVNNAGVDSSGKQVADMAVEDWDNVLKSDLYGPFYCCQQFVRARRAAGGKGKIINITSVHEDIPRVGSAGYDAAKGGLRNLTRTLALELAPDRIHVNNIAPGMVLTPMNQSAIDDPKVMQQQVQSIPGKRGGANAAQITNRVTTIGLGAASGIVRVRRLDALGSQTWIGRPASSQVMPRLDSARDSRLLGRRRGSRRQ